MKILILLFLASLLTGCSDNSYITIPESIKFEPVEITDVVYAKIVNEFDTQIRQDTLDQTEKMTGQYDWDQTDEEGNHVVEGFYFVDIFSVDKNRRIGKGMVVVE